MMIGPERIGNGAREQIRPNQQGQDWSLSPPVAAIGLGPWITTSRIGLGPWTRNHSHAWECYWPWEGESLLSLDLCSLSFIRSSYIAIYTLSLSHNIRSPLSNSRELHSSLLLILPYRSLALFSIRLFLVQYRVDFEALPPLLRCPQKELTVNPFLLRHGNCFQGLDAASESKVEKGYAPYPTLKKEDSRLFCSTVSRELLVKPSLQQARGRINSLLPEKEGSACAFRNLALRLELAAFQFPGAH